MVPTHAQKRKEATHEPALFQYNLLLQVKQKFVMAVHGANACANAKEGYP